MEEATCTKNGKKSVTCKICGDTVIITIDAAHDYGSWVTDFEPNCEREGQKSRTCNVCGDVITQSIDRTKHNYDEWIASDEFGHERVCKDCGETEYNEHNSKNEICELCGYKDGDTPSKDLIFESIGDGYMLAGTNPETIFYDLKIPATYKGLPVIAIEGDALNDQRYFLESVFIPASIRYIYTGQDYPNTLCALDDLKEINVDENNEYFTSENGMLFSKDKTILYRVPQATLQSFTIPDNVTEIGAGAFYGHTQLKSVTFHSALTKLGRRAFEGCYYLNNVTIPASVELIDYYAFRGCTGLKEVTFEHKYYNAEQYGSIVTNISIGNIYTAASALRSKYVGYQIIKQDAPTQ